VDELTTDRLKGLIEKVSQDPNYRKRAEYFHKVISKTRGLDVAAGIIEQAFQGYETDNLANKEAQLSHHGRR
jgi:UDP:flavonoid glycosyltransferase YjiC (YdhE family)